MSASPQLADHAAHVAQVMTASSGLGFPDGTEGRRPAGLRGVLEAVGRTHGLAPEQVLAGRKLKRLVLARQDFMWRARQVTGRDGGPRYSLPAIAGFLGLKDHTTVLWGVRRRQARLEVGR